MVGQPTEGRPHPLSVVVFGFVIALRAEIATVHPFVALHAYEKGKTGVDSVFEQFFERLYRADLVK